MKQPYESYTLTKITKHLTVTMCEDGKPIDFPFNVENFCKENDEQLNQLIKGNRILKEMVDIMLTDFAFAIKCLRVGKKVARKAWGEIACIQAQRSDTITSPYLVIVAFNEKDNIRQPWTPSPDDIFAIDWVLVK